MDWLCLQCKNAHARVRLTKDHVVTHKSNEEARQIRGLTHTDKLLCQVGYFENLFFFLVFFILIRFIKKN